MELKMTDIVGRTQLKFTVDVDMDLVEQDIDIMFKHFVQLQ